MGPIFGSLVRKTLYALLANVAALLAAGMLHMTPAGSPVDLWVWGAVTSLLTGLIAAIRKAIQVSAAKG